MEQTESKESLLVRALKQIVRPHYQIFAFISTILVLFFLSDRAITTIPPLEKETEIYSFNDEQLSREPAVIQVGLRVNALPEFNLRDGTFVLEGKLWFEFDPQLIAINTIEKFTFEQGKILYQSEPEVKIIDDKLSAEYNIRIMFNSNLLLQSFPFDNHRIFIDLTNTNLVPNEVIFQSNESQFTISQHIFTPAWKIIRQHVKNGYTESTTGSEKNSITVQHPKVLFSIDFQRSGLRRIFIIIFPLLLICILSMIALGLRETIGGRLTLDMTKTGTVSMIAYQFVIASLSPQVGYFMFSDYIFIFLLVTSFTQLIFSKITYSHERLTPTAITVRGILFIIFHIALISIWYYLLFMRIPHHIRDKRAHEKTAQLIESADDTEQNMLSEKNMYDSDKAILPIGTMLDLSRASREYGKQVKEGINIRINKAIHDNALPVIPEVSFLDDASYIQKARNNLEAFIQNNISILLSPVGSTSLQAYFDTIVQKNILVLFPMTGATLFRNPNVRNIIHYRLAFSHEAAALTRYTLDVIGSQRIAFLYQDDLRGKSSLEGARNIIKEYNIDPDHIMEIPYEKHNVTFERQIKIINKSEPDTIIFFSTGRAARAFIRQMGVAQLVDNNLLGISRLDQKSFQEFITDKGIPFVTTAVVPNPATSDLEIAQEFRAATNNLDISNSPVAFESYINTDIFLHIIKNIDGEITKEKIINYAEQIRNYNHKGLLLNFDPKTRELGTAIWLNTGTDEWKQIDKKFFNR